MLGALQRMRHHDEHALARQQRRLAHDLARIDAADRRRPRGILHDTVATAHQIVFEDRPAGAMAREESAIVPVVGDQRMCDAEHQRRVGAGPQRQPFGLDLIGQIGVQRADEHEAGAARVRLAHIVALGVAADAAGGDAGVLQRHAAEGEHDLGDVGDVVPTDVSP